MDRNIYRNLSPERRDVPSEMTRELIYRTGLFSLRIVNCGLFRCLSFTNTWTDWIVDCTVLWVTDNFLSCLCPYREETSVLTDLSRMRHRLKYIFRFFVFALKLTYYECPNLQKICVLWKMAQILNTVNVIIVSSRGQSKWWNSYDTGIGNDSSVHFLLSEPSLFLSLYETLFCDYSNVLNLVASKNLLVCIMYCSHKATFLTESCPWQSCINHPLTNGRTGDFSLLALRLFSLW